MVLPVVMDFGYDGNHGEAGLPRCCRLRRWTVSGDIGDHPLRRSSRRQRIPYPGPLSAKSLQPKI